MVLAAGLALSAGARQPEVTPPTPPASAPVTPAERAAPAAAPAEPSAALASGKPTRIALDAFVAEGLQRIAMLDLRNQDEPTPADYRIAGAILARVQEMRPDDAELLRRRIEAAFNAGDADLVDTLTRRLVSLDPKDTVAQLSVITAQIRRAQTAPARLALHDRFVASAGLDASVRSRLAFDAAMLAREMGDTTGFELRLKEAMRLDPTNKNAAALAVTYYEEDQDPPERYRLLLNLLLADPLDPTTHRAISELLASTGAFKAAEAFAQHADTLAPATDAESNRQRLLDTMVLRWLNDSPLTPLKKLTDDLDLQRASAAIEIEKVKATRTGLGMEVASLPKPEDVRLTISADRFRVLAADAAGDTQKMAEAMGDLVKSASYKAESLENPTRRPLGLSEEDALRQSSELKLEMALFRAIMNIDAKEVVAARETFATDTRIDPVRLRTLDAWILLREQKHAEARTAFEAADQDDIMVALGLAQLDVLGGNTSSAVERYRAIGRAMPTRPVGAWALAKMRTLLGRADEPLTPMASEMEKLGASLPQWVERMVRDPRSFMSLSFRVPGGSIGALQPVAATLTVRNVSPVPMAVGSQSPINSRFLISPQFDTRGQLVRGLAPEVLTLDRRLRLMPGEIIEADVSPEAGPAGWELQSIADTSVRGRWRIVQAFYATGATVDAPRTALTNETGAMIRQALPETSLGVPALAARLTGCKPEELPALLVAARTEYARGDEDVQPLTAALIERYKAGTRRERTAMLVTLPNAASTPGIRPFDEAARGEQDPELLALVLLTRVAAFDDPALTASVSSSDPTLAALARDLAARRDAGGALLGAAWPVFSAAGVRERVEQEKVGP